MCPPVCFQERRSKGRKGFVRSFCWLSRTALLIDGAGVSLVVEMVMEKRVC